jgi:4-amino-4-deoxy-L-arabinose transferase-like glycosyltransferase
MFRSRPLVPSWGRAQESARASAQASARAFARAFARRSRRAVREHWLVAVILLCGTAVRVAVQFAYQQALIFPDSERYLQYAQNFLNGDWSPDWLRTSGYSLLLMPAVLAHNLTVVVAIQHLMGLAMGVLVYATLIHFGARRWLAAVCTIPVLFDPLELDIEQYILTDISATFLVVVALVVLVWRREALSNKAAWAAGVLIAAATIIRENDLLVMIPALLYLLVIIRPRRRLLARAGRLLAGCLIPVLGYLAWFFVWFHTFNFVTYSNQFMYGRIAQFADCTGLSLPPYEEYLCPQQPPAERNPDFYMWAPLSPQVTLTPTAGLSKGQIIHAFNWAILKHQPLTYVEVVANDILYSFSPVRGDGPEKYPTAYHDFHTYFPSGKGEEATLRAFSHASPRVQPELAGFLTDYGHDFWVPGPVLAGGLVLGLAGMAGIGRARARSSPARARPAPSRLRAPCMLFTLGAIFLVIPPFIIATFDWRYELPQFPLIPIAAVLGVMAMIERRGHAGDPAAVSLPGEETETPAGGSAASPAGGSVASPAAGSAAASAGGSAAASAREPSPAPAGEPDAAPAEWEAPSTRP